MYKEKHSGVNKDIEKRWNEGTPHHKESIKLYKILKKIDHVYCDDFLNWKSKDDGDASTIWSSESDGDNGEMLMYALDLYFECKDAKEKLF
jgi:hypothetical protein